MRRDGELFCFPLFLHRSTSDQEFSDTAARDASALIKCVCHCCCMKTRRDVGNERFHLVKPVSCCVCVHLFRLAQSRRVHAVFVCNGNLTKSENVLH